MTIINGGQTMSMLSVEIKVINLGLKDFADNLWRKKIPVVHVKWSPPAMGDDNLLKLIDILR